MTGSILEKIDADLIEPQRLAQSVIDQIKVERRRPATKGQRGITPFEALKALACETKIVAVCAQNLAHGIALNDADHARLLVAWARVETIFSEATR